MAFAVLWAAALAFSGHSTNSLVEDPISGLPTSLGKKPLVGNTAETVPTCKVFEQTVCQNGASWAQGGGPEMLAPDAPEHGLVAHYNFEDAIASDTSGNGNHAKVAPETGPGHGPTSWGAWFDGMRMMEVPHIEEMNSPDITIMFWMYLLEDSTNSYRTLVRKASGPADMTPSLMLLPNDRRLHLRLTTTHEHTVGFDSTALIPMRRWTHVAYVLKGGAALSLYVNGVKDCPVVGNNRHSSGCPPGGATYAWDEGDVLFNKGPLYVGADPFMSGAAMFMDSLKVFKIALGEKDIIQEASDALGLAGPRFLRLGCLNCTEPELSANCAELDEYHPCLCVELMSGGLATARTMGWLRGPSSEWKFHADARNPLRCEILPDGPPETGAGFCCHD